MSPACMLRGGHAIRERVFSVPLRAKVKTIPHRSPRNHHREF